MKWQSNEIEIAPEGVEVETMTADEHGVRNQTNLVRKGNLWFLPNMKMYVYYAPTHWKSLTGD